MSIHDSRESIGRAGLMSLMGDPRVVHQNDVMWESREERRLEVKKLTK